MEKTKKENAKRLGKYKILAKLGEGGFGKVYKAFDTVLERVVAVKTLKLEDQNELKRFLREAKATAKLDHPNIVSLYTIEKIEKKYCLIMKLIEGQSLREILKKEKFSIPRCCQMMMKILQAMEYAHEQGFIHRDIKPANILVDKEGEPYLTDFGLVKFSQGEHTQLTEVGAIVGTPCYMAPEQGSGNVDSRSDIYSLGATLYEMLTQKAPFEGETILQVLYKTVNEVPRSPREIRKEIPQNLEDICLKAMKKEREERYQDIAEMKKAVEKILASYKNPRGKASRAKHKKQAKVNHQNIYVILALAFIVLVIVLVSIPNEQDSNSLEKKLASDSNSEKKLSIDEEESLPKPENSSLKTIAEKTLKDKKEEQEREKELKEKREREKELSEGREREKVLREELEREKELRGEREREKEKREKQEAEKELRQKEEKKETQELEKSELLVEETIDSEMEQVKEVAKELLKCMKNQDLAGVKNICDPGFSTEAFPPTNNPIWEGVLKTSFVVIHSYFMQREMVFTWEDDQKSLAKLSIGPKLSEQVYFKKVNGEWKCTGDKVSTIIHTTKKQVNISGYSKIHKALFEILEKAKRGNLLKHHTLFHSQVEEQDRQNIAKQAIDYFSLKNTLPRRQRFIQKSYFFNEEEQAFIIYYDFRKAKGLFIGKNSLAKELDKRKRVYLVLKKEDDEWRIYGIKRCF